MSRSSADTVIHLFFEIVNCGEHLEDVVSSDSWWVPEIGESYGFTLLFILSYLGNPDDVWELWLIRAVNFHFSGYIYYGSYFRCCVVGCRNQERRCSTRGVCVDWLLPHTCWRASFLPTQRAVTYVKISGTCFTKLAREVNTPGIIMMRSPSLF